MLGSFAFFGGLRTSFVLAAGDPAHVLTLRLASGDLEEGWISFVKIPHLIGQTDVCAGSVRCPGVSEAGSGLAQVGLADEVAGAELGSRRLEGDGPGLQHVTA